MERQNQRGVPARAEGWGSAVNRYVPGRTVLAKAREKIAANLGNVNFWLLALWELVDGRKNKSDRTRNNLCGERLEG